MGYSVIFANGDIKCDDDLTKCVVVADGDIEIARLATSCILIARGNIKTDAFECMIAAGGTAQSVSKKRTLKDSDCQNTVTEGDTNPLGIITFFELSQIGVTAADKDNVVRIAKLTEASSLRKAGVAPDDKVSKVNGAPVTTTEELRRALRDAIATKGDATVTVVRDGKPTDIKVSFPE